MIAIGRIQAQLRESARTNYEAFRVPPFTCFINSDDPSPWANYAIPDAPILDDVSDALSKLADTFNAHGRTPRFEFLDEFSPLLGAILTGHGYVDEGQTFLLVCTPLTLVVAPSITGLSASSLRVSELTADAPLSRVQEFLTVQRRAFGNDDSTSVDADEAALFRNRFASTRLFAVWVDGQIVSAGSLTPSHDGVAEITGIATLSTFRRRGIGAALTDEIARAAFASGLQAVFLTARDAAAGRIYARVGFQPAGVACAYYLPTNPNA
ncbi:MAG: GNAT family N-acetyltransferase [Caldilineaceae bacterium]|nr:GNAT family N-acetyltransferase [Caldilineaceae bacterium]